MTATHHALLPTPTMPCLLCLPSAAAACKACGHPAVGGTLMKQKPGADTSLVKSCQASWDQSFRRITLSCLGRMCAQGLFSRGSHATPSRCPHVPLACRFAVAEGDLISYLNVWKAWEVRLHMPPHALVLDCSAHHPSRASQLCCSQAAAAVWAQQVTLGAASNGPWPIIKTSAADQPRRSPPLLPAASQESGRSKKWAIANYVMHRSLLRAADIRNQARLWPRVCAAAWVACW